MASSFTDEILRYCIVIFATHVCLLETYDCKYYAINKKKNLQNSLKKNTTSVQFPRSLIEKVLPKVHLFP